MANSTASSVCLALQSELQSKALPKDTKTPRKRTFFKQSELRAILTQYRITELLSCRCSSCKFWWNTAGLRCSDADLRIKAQEILGQSTQQQASVLILSLLVLNGCAPLIISFVNKRCYDEEMRSDLERFSAAYFDRIFLPRAKHSDQLAISLSEDKWRIFPTMIDDLVDNERLNLPAEAILPFINDTKIGEGAYGVVFCSEVPDEYVNITRGSATCRFARKVTKEYVNPHDFEREASNLYEVRKIENPHLLHVHKAFKHGDTGVIILPLARSSLKERLRDDHLIARSDQLENIHIHPFWTQLLGVSEALAQLHKFEVPEDYREDILFGYHFDLKPANILITTEGAFVISDFGQAYFRRNTDATTSKVVGMGGAEAYAPPEIDDPNAKLNRKYDVWSLGCIFLEIIWYLMKGSAGVHELENYRLTRSQYKQEERYFAKDEHGKYGVKAEIVEKTKSLIELLETKPARGFLHFIIRLTFQMLDGDVGSRLSALEVSAELRTGLKNGREGKLMHEDPAVLLAKLFEGDPSAILTDLSHLTNLKYKQGSEWRQQILGLVEQSRSVSLIYYEDGKATSTLLGNRSKLRLIPSYATGQEAQSATSPAVASLRLVEASLDCEISQETCHDFQSRNLTDILKLQSVLLQRDILGHWTLTSARLEKASGIFGALTGRRKSDTILEKASALQLWVDCPTGSNVSRGTLSTAQRPRRTSLEPVMRRLVMYSPENIYVFQVGRGFRSLWDEDSSSINLIPDQRQDRPEFTAHVFQYSSKPAMTGLALSKANFELYESKTRTKYDSMNLELSAASEAMTFRKIFRKERKAWFSECDTYEKRKHELASDLGYEEM